MTGNFECEPIYLKRELRKSVAKLREILEFCQAKGKLSVQFEKDLWCFSFPKIAEIKDNYTKDLQAPSKLLAKEKKREEKNKSKKREEKKEPVGELLIPDWINFLTWEDFTKMRQSIKKPLTKIAITRILNKLEKFKNQGMNVEDILSESIENSWAGVFAIKGFKPNKGSVNNKDFGDNNDKW